MHDQADRDEGPPPRHGALAVAGWLAACLLPVAAHALGPGCQLDPTRAGNYTQDMGAQAALAIRANAPDVGQVQSARHCRLRCPFAARTLGVHQRQHEYGAFPGVWGNMAPVLNELRKVGLKLVIQMWLTWEPTGRHHR